MERRRAKDRRTREGGDTDWNDAATSQGMSIATKSWKGQVTDFPLGPLEGVQPSQHLDFGRLPSRTLENKFLLFQSPSFWKFIAVGLGN